MRTDRVLRMKKMMMADWKSWMAAGALLLAVGVTAGWAEEAATAAPAAPAAQEEAAAPAKAEEEAPAPAGPAVLLIDSKPTGLKVFVDGNEVGEAPVSVQGLSDNPHEIIVYHPEKGAVSKKIEGNSGKVIVDTTSAGNAGAGFLLIESTPADARVDVDGKRMGLAPLKIPVAAGRHTVVLAKDGYVEKSVTLELKAGESAPVKGVLAEKPGAILVITSPAGGEVSLDGKKIDVAKGPLKIPGVTPGEHEIRVTKAGFSTWARSNVRVTRDATETVLAALLPEQNESNVRIYTEPDGPRMWLDGKEQGVVGPEGLGFHTDKGVHILRFELNPAVRPGYRAFQISASFSEDTVDYQKTPIKIPVIDEAFISAQKLYERGENKEAMSFLDRVGPQQSSYAEARVMMTDILRNLHREAEIPAEFEKLFTQQAYQQNPVLNLAAGYWGIQAAQKATAPAAVADQLKKSIDALDRCIQFMDYFPSQERQGLALKAHYYMGIASELLFAASGEKKYVKKGVQAWELFFARMTGSEETLGNDWVEKARQHQKNLRYLEKKLGG